MTENQLLEAVARQGYNASSDKLKRWRRAGLIARPIQEHSPGRRGSQWTYPPGTLAQLVAVCRLRARFKSLDRVRFELWWAGEYVGDLTPIRDFLVDKFDRLLSGLRRHRDRFDDPFDAAEAAVGRGAFTSRDPVMRAMRRLAKSDENLRSAIHAVFWDLSGGEVTWHAGDPHAPLPEPSLAELVEQALGVTRAKIDLLESGQPLLNPETDITDAIHQNHVRGVIDLDHPGLAIRLSRDDELNEARSKAALLLSGLQAFAAVVALRHGRDYSGLSVLKGVSTSDPTAIAFAVQLVLSLPSLLDDEEERENAERTFSALLEHAMPMHCIELFSSEHRGYAFIFTSDAPERLQTLNDEERALLNKTIDSFLRRHPECAALMAAEE